MSVRPIIFSGPMLSALLDGRKTMTRRVMKPQPGWVRDRTMFWRGTATMIAAHRLPYASGDLLWVRETWSEAGTRTGAAYAADYPHDTKGYGWRPSIHMPRWASRFTLTVTDVRMQRVQEISEADAIREGVTLVEETCEDPRDAFQHLWDSINGKRPGCAWADNPWVYAVTFTTERANIDAVLQRQEVAA